MSKVLRVLFLEFPLVLKLIVVSEDLTLPEASHRTPHPGAQLELAFGIEIFRLWRQLLIQLTFGVYVRLHLNDTTAVNTRHVHILGVVISHHSTDPLL